MTAVRLTTRRLAVHGEVPAGARDDTTLLTEATDLLRLRLTRGVYLQAVEVVGPLSVALTQHGDGWARGVLTLLVEAPVVDLPYRRVRSLWRRARARVTR